MAEATFSLAVENLSNLLIQKRGILLGVEGQVKDEIQKRGILIGVVGQVEALKDELQRMKYFLRTAVENQATDRAINDWISQLVEIALDAEDVIEIFIFKVDTPGSSELPSLADHVKHLQMLGQEIQLIQTRVQHMIRNFQLLGVGMLISRRSEDIQLQRISSPWQTDEHLVGLEEDVELLLRTTILKESRDLSITSIVGIGGIGKTTLAKKLFHHSLVVEKFACRAWVMISQVINQKEIIKEMLLQLLHPDEDDLKTMETMEKLQLRSLQVLLQRRLHNKRYFIVLDDVCEATHFELLASIFPNEDNASRLLITSRNRNATRGSHYTHEMITMHPTQSWELFLKMAFSGQPDINCPEHLEITGRLIWSKCHNLPSAVKEPGRQLVGRQTEAEWVEVLNTMNLGVISDGFELSYHELPPELKLCFLCLSFFRKGETISADKLVQIWIAGGMVPQRGQMNEAMEEIARSYLDNLISRFMVQVEDKTKDRRVKNCRIYDVFHKLSIKKAEDEINFEILMEEVNSRPIHKPRHRAIYCSRESSIYSINQDNYLRSLFFHGVGQFDDRLSYWSSFVLLRILDFEGFGLQEFPHAICSLTGLKFLGLRNNYIRELPDSLSCLYKPKVLDISLNFGLIVPDTLWEMDSLHHLYMSEIICRGPLRIDALKSIQTLTYISLGNWTYTRSSLQVMTKLRKLGIEELNEHSDVSNLFASLAHLENLVSMNLKGSRFRIMPSLDEVGYLHRLTKLKLDGLVTTLPNAHNFPQNLCYLTLANTSLDEDPMSVLEELPELLFLKLRNAYAGDRLVISCKGFKKLQVLCIGELWHLRNVEIEEVAMPMLEKFEIYSCPNLENLPRGARTID